MSAAPVIAVNPAYNLLFNNMTKTVLLNQLLYWDARKVLKRWDERWIVKTSEQLAEEICHGSAKSVGDWLREFKAMGIIYVRRAFFNGKNQLWIQINHDKLRQLMAELSVENLPETDVPVTDNLPEMDVPMTDNLPETDSPTPVSYPTGNSISKITSSEKIDHQIEDDWIFKFLSREQIDAVTERVTAQINSRRMTPTPIRNPQRYLRVALENEARNIQARQSVNPVEADPDPFFMRDITLAERMPEPELPQTPTDAIWEAVLAQIEAQWDEANYTTWLQPTYFLRKDDRKYVIATPNSYVCDMLEFRLGGDIKAALCKLTQRDFEIEYVVRRMRP